MSDFFKVDLTNVEGFSQRMRQAPEIVREEVTDGVRKAAESGAHQAKQHAPVKSGTLRRSIVAAQTSYAGGAVTGSYGTNIPYARYVEEGFGPISAKNKKALKFVVGGKTVIVKRTKKKVAGKFYMKKSREWLEPQLQRHFQGVAVRIIQRLGG